ncbi:MAG: DUF3024 domain-containing protein [Polyangiaceae bacterium]|nr:DUF3024 domain-containing protein [Polyangiaceae bacterium]
MHTPVVRLRFVRTTGLWPLYWMRADLRWHTYGPAAPTADLAALVEVVDRDEYCAFFGPLSAQHDAAGACRSPPAPPPRPAWAPAVRRPRP